MRRGTKRHGVFLGLSALIWACLGSVSLWAYEVKTHNEIALRAVNVSSIDSVLKSELALPDGKASVFNERTAEQWVSEGVELEDDPIRFFNHFHNPLRPWGLAGVLLFAGQSSVRWQQDGSQDWSWQDARQDYKEALTSAQPQQQKAAFAKTFRALGQLIHLIQDATVPAHARNDPHLLGEPYEDWVEKNLPSVQVQSFLDSQPVDPPDSIFTPTGDTLAPVAIARLIDSDMFDGNNAAPLTDPAIGVAEYTNGNFLSEGAMFGSFVMPRESNLGAEIFVPETTPSGQKFRRYFRKRGAGETGGEGESVDHFVAEGLLYETILAEAGFPLSASYTLVGLVHNDYAAKLLPRAVGYSVGLLDYFFRGTLDFTIDASSPNQTLTITNKSEETMDGTFTLYADNFSDIRSPVQGASFNLNLGPMAPSGPLTFTPPGEVQAYTLVFQGKLGLEDDAVAGKVNEWYAVTDVTPGSITPGQLATINITIKSNFSRQQQTLVAALFDGNAVELASTSAVVPNSGPTTTNISLEVTPTTIPSSAAPPISLVVASDADIATITPADLSNQAAGDPMTLVRVGQASRLPIYQRVMHSCQAKIRSVAFASDAQSSGTPTLTINAPANLQDGDILLGHVFFRITSGIPFITSPSGFMVVGFDNGESNIRMNASSKVALGEGGSFTWTATNASGNHWIAFGALIAISGANTSDFEDIDVDDQSFLWSDITPTLTKTTIIRMGIASNSATPFTITGPSAPYEELYNEILTLPGGSPWFGVSYRWFGYSMESNAAEANSASVQADPLAFGRHGYSVAVISGTCP